MRSESEMTHEDIIRMAEEAGIGNAFSLEKNQYVYRFGHGSVERFAALVAAAERDANKKLWESLQFSDEKIANCIEVAVAAEREACAKVCEAQIQEWVDDRPRYAVSECAGAIRARGEG